jgi:hypothetical protein
MHAQVFVKILEVAEDGGGRIKIGASIKVLDQESGADLDPNNLAGSRSPPIVSARLCALAAELATTKFFRILLS